MHVLYVTVNVIIIVFFGMVLPFILIDLPGFLGSVGGASRPLIRTVQGWNMLSRNRWPYGPMRPDPIRENERAQAIKLGFWPKESKPPPTDSSGR